LFIKIHDTQLYVVLLTTLIMQQCAVPGGNIINSLNEVVSSEKILLDSVLFKLNANSKWQVRIALKWCILNRLVWNELDCGSQQ